MLSLLTLPRDVLYLIFKRISPADQLAVTIASNEHKDGLSQQEMLWRRRYIDNELPQLQNEAYDRKVFIREYIRKGNELIDEITFLRSHKVEIMELFNGNNFRKASSLFNLIDSFTDNIKSFKLNLSLVDQTVEKINLLIATTQMPAHRSPVLQMQFITRLSDDWVDAFCKKYPQVDNFGVGNLCHLDLRNTQLKTLPYNIGRLCFIESLNLYDTKLQEIPDTISNLKNLRQFLASGGNLKTFPKALLSCTALSSLSLMDMGIEDLPNEISELKVLYHLWVNDNNIKYCPESLASLSLLRELRLEGNQLSFFQPAKVKQLLQKMNIDLQWLIEHQQGNPTLTESEQDFYDLGQSLDRIKGQLQAIKLDDTETQMDELSDRLSNISLRVTNVKETIQRLKAYRADEQDGTTPGDNDIPKKNNAKQNK